MTISALDEGAPPGRATEDLAELAAGAGLRRIEVVAWRDLGHPEAGGSEVHAAEVAQRWAAAGVDVCLTASRAPGAAATARSGRVVVRRPAGRYGIFPVAAARGAPRRGRGRPDGVVEIWNGMPFLSPLWARDVPRAVWLHHVHDGMWDLTLPPPLARVGRAVELRLAPRLYRSTPIVTLSQSSRRTIIELLDLPAEQVHVVNPGVDGRFRPLGPPSLHPLFVAVGRLMPYKRFDVVVEALVAARRRHPDLEAVIVGEGRERGALADLVAAHGASGWLRLAGRVGDGELVELYRRAWAVISASAFEGWGLTLTEAAACGTPAIASRIPGHVDAIREGRSGWLFGSTAELEAAVLALIERPGARRRLREGALRRAAELSWDRTAWDTLALLAAEAVRRRATG